MVNNNNYGNLRPVGSSTGFRSFATPEEGISAMRDDLLAKVTGKSKAMAANYGQNYRPTLNTVISTYAPPSENDTQNYINFVSNKTGINPDQTLTPQDLDSVIPAMVKMESGKDIQMGGAANDTVGVFSVVLPDGTEIENIPVGTTKKQVRAKLEAGGYKFPDSTPVEPTNKEQGIGRTALDQSMQGATFGLADEASDFLGAVGAKLYDKTLGDNVTAGQSIGDLYDEARGMSSDRLAQQMEQRPALSIGANIAGGLLTGVASTGTKAGAKVADWVGRGGLGLRAAKAGATGAASGAAYGFGAGDGTVTDRLESAGENALIGGVAGGAISAGGSAAIKAWNNLSGGKIDKVTSDTIKALANQKYREVEQKGGVFSADFTDKLLNTIDDYKPKHELGRMLSKGDPVVALADDIAAKRGQQMTLAEAAEFDEMLSDRIDDFIDNGHVTKKAKRLMDIQSDFRSMMNNVDDADVIGGKDGIEALKEGRKYWSDSMKMRDIEKIITRAELTDNPATSIKTGFRTLLLNDKKIRAFSDDERKLIKQAAESGVVTDLLRTAGSRLVPIIAGASGGGLGASAAGAAASMASRGAATKLQIGKAEKLIDAITSKYQPVNTKPPLLTDRIKAAANKPITSNTLKRLIKDESGTLDVSNRNGLIFDKYMEDSRQELLALRRKTLDKNPNAVFRDEASGDIVEAAYRTAKDLGYKVERSNSGSVYITLPNGKKMRVSDHASAWNRRSAEADYKFTYGDEDEVKNLLSQRNY